MRNRIMNALKLNTARLLVLVMLLSGMLPLLSELAPRVRAADATIDTGGVIVITESGSYVIDGTDKEIYSITVSGSITANLYLYNVKIDGRDWTYPSYDGKNSTTYLWVNATSTACSSAFEALYRAGTTLGWTGSGVAYAPTCPVLVTNGATATVEMNGDNVFRAGVNKVTVTKNGSSYSVGNSGISGTTLKSCGYAGIQVDPGATLTIKGTANSSCAAYGGWQFEGRRPHRNDGEATPWANPTFVANNTTYNMLSEDSGARTSGAAGIGGGASYNADRFGISASLRFGSSGNLIINGLDCKISAYGGHQSAGIGGACNSPAAAVGHSITINSGDITVNGGRWAAGIGDGDTINGNVSSDFYTASTSLSDSQKYFININGGTLSVSGGIGAAGIGSSDKVSVEGDGGGVNSYSRLAINILGGNVTVRSGFPDAGANGNYANKSESLSAAIGAGSETNMLPNSITVGAGVTLDAASFSKYAINNYGTAANINTVPVVNLDSASHLFLCNFSSYPSSVDRTISLYAAEYKMVYEYVDEVYNELQKSEIYKYNDSGVEKTLAQVTTTVGKNLVTGFVFLDTHSVNGQDIYVLADPVVLYPYNVTIGGKDYYCTTESETVAANGILAEQISYAKDIAAGAIDAYSVPDYFKAIAVTLPSYDPEDDSTAGHYVVDIPLTGVANNLLPDGMASGSSLTAGVNSMEQGVISGTIQYPLEHNIKLDPVTGDLESMKVFAGNTASGTDYLGLGLGETPLYSYNVYLPAGTTQATLQITYDGDFTVQYTQPTNAVKASGEVYTVGVSAGNPVTVRVRVQETVNGTQLSAVTYVITLYVREQYKMEINASASKVYDGTPYKIVISDVVVKDRSSNAVPVTQELFEQIVFDYSVPDPTDAGSYEVTASLSPDNAPWQTSVTHSFSITQRELKITGVQNWMQYLAKNSDSSTTGPFEVGEIYFTGVVNGDSVSITVANGTADSVYDINGQNDRNGENYLRLQDPIVDNPNYTVQYTSGTYVDVMCRIYYDMKGAIFRNDGIANGSTHKWDKFFPVDSEDPLDFTDPSVSANYQHAQGSHTHTESVFFHSVNNGETQMIYCVDVEFGSLDFTFTKRVWNVSMLDYDDTNGAWIGFDSVQNCVTVYNYSNAPVNIDIVAEVDPSEAQQLLGQKGLGIKLDSICGEVKEYETAFRTENPTSLFPSRDTASFSVSAATPKSGAIDGTPGTASYYVFLLNSPKFGENAGKQTTASITVTVSQTP